MTNIILIREFESQAKMTLFTMDERAKLRSLVVYLFEEGVKLPYEWARIGTYAYQKYREKHLNRDPLFCHSWGEVSAGKLFG